MKAGVTFRVESKVVRYEFALRQAGIEPVRIPAESKVSIDALEGLVLTGGTDINPARYGETPGPETDEPDDQRDEMETRLLQEALQAGLPVLAICRGMQLFNVAHGGSLIQHLPSVHIHSATMPDLERGRHTPNHPVFVSPQTRLAAIIGEGEHAVNSRHHQAVERLGEGLIVSAISHDGVIEAVERTGPSFAVAVQWHPEDRILVSEPDRLLFEAFAVAVSSFSFLVSR